MTLEFHPESRREFRDSMLWYREIEHGLADRFQKQNDSVIARILSNPHQVRLRKRGYRRISLKLFPYYLPYIIRGEIIIILAVAHSSRHPDYWKDRIS